MPTLTVYDPPMCCSSGVCGPEVDPKLSQFAADLDWLGERGIEVERINLAQEPGRFVANAAVKAILDQSDGDDLPAIVIGDALVAHGRYPAREELASFVGLSDEPVAEELSDRVKELIALGAAIAASCEPCFKFHYDKARKLGLTTADMQQALRIGEAVKAASAKNIVGLADKLIGRAEPAASACCGSSEVTPTSKPQTSEKKCC